MNISLKKMTLIQQILLISVVPLLAILYFSFTLIYKEYTLYTSTTNLQTALNIAFKATDLVHELQKERGLTAGYLSSKGAKFQQELQAQRKVSDEKLLLLEEAYRNATANQFTKEFFSPIQEGMEQIKQIPNIRTKISSQQTSTDEAIAFYSSQIAKYLTGISAVGGEGSDALLSSLTGAFGYFLNAKELAGQERAVVNGIIARNVPITQDLFMRWNSLYFGQDTLMKSFMALAKHETVEFYKETIRGNAIDKVTKIRETVREKAESGEFGIAPTKWFDASTQRINLLQKVSQQQVELIKKQTENLISDAKFNLLMYTIIATLITLFVIMIVVYIAWSLNRFFTQSISEISDSNAQVTAASNEISASAIGLAEGASIQASRIEAVNNVVHETLDANLHNVQEAQEADKLASDTNRSVEVGNESINQLMNSMKNIIGASEKIAHIIKNIDQISFQTNILALNAAVEAARAGEHGLGFAVVADEVKNLAHRSAVSAEETAAIIEEAIRNINEGDVIAKKTQKVFNDIFENAKKTMQITKSISSSLQRQGTKMQEISEDMQSIDNITQQNSATSEEAAASAEELNAQAVTMMHNLIEVAKLVGVELKAEWLKQ